MTTYRIPAGTRVWRITLVEDDLPAKSGIDWGPQVLTAHDVVYEEQDRRTPAFFMDNPREGWDEYYIFRLPNEALPYTFFAVRIDVVKKVEP